MAGQRLETGIQADPLDVDTLGTEATRDTTDSLEPPPGPHGTPVQPVSGPRLGRYILREELGRGGMGVVYRAFDPDLNRDVAIKFHGFASGLSERGRRRFQLEARTIARLDHPHIVRVYDTGQRDGFDYFVMRLVRGPSLARRLEQGPLPPAQAVRIAQQVAGALAYAHREGLVHRDVKPANILLDGGEQPVLTDFGVVKDLSDASPALTADSRMIGTPAYMAPEQLRHGVQVGPTADQYALGMVLYEMLTGSRPPRGNAGQPSDASVSSPPVTPVPADSRTFDALLRICRKAMAEETIDRYPDMDALAMDLERCLRGEPIQAAPPPLHRRARRWARAHPGPLAATSVAALLILGLAAAALSAWLDHREAARLEAAAEDRRNATERRVAALLQAGEQQEADAAFRSFATLPANEGTRALARGWLHHADRLRDRKDDQGEGQALASAYTTAVDLAERGEALRGLARLLRRQWAWDALDELIDTAPERAPSLQNDPELARMRAEAAFARRDFQQVLEIPGIDGTDGLQRLARAFSSATRTEHLYDGDQPFIRVDPRTGTRSLYLYPRSGNTTPVLSLRSPLLPPEPSLTFADDSLNRGIVIPLQEGPGQPASLLTWQGSTGKALLYGRNGQRLELLHSWPSSALGEALSADLDRDGKLEIYVATQAYQRDLRVLRWQPSGSWTMGDAHPPTSLSASDLSALALTDLDRDGRQELAVAAGSWNAYDVRLLEPDAGGALSLGARNKIGSVLDLAVLPGPVDRLAALKLNLYPNPQMFSPERPFGPPPGVWLLRREGKELIVDRHIPLPESWWAQRIHVADLDGDGRRDLVVGRARLDSDRTLLFLQQADGSFEELTLLGVGMLGAANLDDDPADELIVSIEDGGRRLWVLGVGEGRLPPLDRARPVRAVPPPSDPAVAGVWHQAEDLAAIGQVDSAVERLRRLAEQTLRADTITAALLRGADLSRADGRPRQAAELYEAAADQDSPRRLEGLTGAAETWRSLNRFEAALPMVERLLAAPDLPGTERSRWERERSWLRSRLDPVRSWRFDFSGPLEAAWRVTSPDGLRWRRSTGGLELDIVERPQTEPRARLPLRWDGGPVTLEADMTLERLEWSAGIGILLRTTNGGVLGVAARGFGGRSRLHQQIGCRSLRSTPSTSLQVDGPEAPRRVVIRMDLLEPGRFRCTLSSVDSGEVLWEEGWEGPPDSPGLWQLEIDGYGGERTGYQRARTIVHSIRVQGMERAAPLEPESSWQAANRLLANGEAGQVLERIDTGQVSAPTIDLNLLRHRALHDLGRPLEAAAALRRALEAGLGRDPARRDQLAALVRELPEQLNPQLQELIGWERWLEVFVAAWEGPANLHPADQLVRNTLVLSLGDQVLARKPRGGKHELVQLVELLSARAWGWLASGQRGTARADLRRSIELLEEALADAREGEPYRLEALRALSSCHVVLAKVELVAGDLDGAMVQVERALDRSPVREITADLMRADPVFKPLQPRADWLRLIGRPPPYLP